MELRYLSVDEVYIIHLKMIEVGGGKSGIRDTNLLLSALERPKVTFAGKQLYPTLWLQAAALLHSLIKNHPFHDGNKRTGYFSTMRFLYINGYSLAASQKELVNFCLTIAQKKTSLPGIAAWLQKNSHTPPPYTE